MSRPNPRLIAALLATVALLPALARAAPEKRFKESTDVIEIQIPVHVVADGQPVRGLTAADFEVFEGRKRRPITGLDAFDLATFEGADAQAVADLPPAARRHMLLLFDLTFSSPPSIVKAREAARELVLEHLQPGDLVAVATFGIRQGARVILGFTPDRHQMEVAIDSLGLPQLVERVNDPLGLVLEDSILDSNQFDGRSLVSNSPGGSLLKPNGPGGTKREDFLQYKYETLIDYLRDQSTLQQRSDRDAQRGFAISFTDGLTSLGKLLSSVEGNKQVILLSEGFDGSLLLGTTDQGEIEDQALSASFGEVWNVDSDQRFGSTAALEVLQKMADAFRRSGATVYTVDVGGLRAGGDAAGELPGATQTSTTDDSLFVIADSTGGELFRNFNDLGEALDRLVTQTGVTYVLSFDPGPLEYDGSYHPIEIRLKDGPRGARLLHRPGYYAPKPAAYQHPLERSFSAADLVMRAHDAGPIGMSVLPAAFPREGGEGAVARVAGASGVFVPLLIRIDGDDLLGGREQGLASLALYAYAFDAQGRVADFFSQSMALDVSKVRQQLHHQTLDFYGRFDLGPGVYTMRFLLQDTTTGGWSFRRVDFTVPEAQHGEPTLLALLVPGPPGARQLLVRQQMGEGEAAYPFVGAAGVFVPVPKPVLSGREAANVYLVTSEPVAARPEVTAWMSTAGGQRVGVRGEVAAGPAVADPGPPFLPVRLEVPPGLPPGDYVLTVSLRPGEGAFESARSIPVTLASGSGR